MLVIISKWLIRAMYKSRGVKLKSVYLIRTALSTQILSLGASQILGKIGTRATHGWA
jgi:hypothetical protein